ncbi:hypothetical protein HYDPIDRAFT_171456 [Hydnomerulius pinastri MD-312]|uniref:adenylate cyclase n=1 Tax=Hydnomerulius pinastri MD-312 TaxID=994086 RepID=A0A0C9VKC5_9AGAM|nr:hypothetical protein HYDPIDRAFT_171456 [Hydnomerulius pinastri MD-312]
MLHDLRKVSPKTIIGPYEPDEGGEEASTEREWTAPESWAVEKEGEDVVEAEANSSSEESIIASSSRTPDDASTVNDTSTKKRMRRKTHHAHKPSSSSESASSKFVRVRIYRANGSYHVAQILPHSTVADLTSSLNAKLLLDQVETHKLYLKERGRERVLAPTERPAAITRRRLEQAGYDQADSLDYIAAEDMTFLLKFVYKSQLFGPAAEDLNFDDFEFVDLTGCGLPTIPIVFHKNAASIVYLNLSRNPMVEIPLDFIQSCVTLRELRLSKLPEDIGRLVALDRLVFVGNQVSKLPEQFSQLASLRVLDCRRNNISDLSIAQSLPRIEVLHADHNFVHALDLSNGPCATTSLDVSYNDITLLKLVPTMHTPYALVSLDVSHAKLSSLDDFAFSHLSALQHLKLDHNLFHALPDSLGELSHLIVLSCSDNHLDALPESIGALQRLESLDAHNNSLTQLPVSLWNCASLASINVTSNLLESWRDPPGATLVAPPPTGISLDVPLTPPGSRSHHQATRKPSSANSIHSTAHSSPGRPSPPLAYSLERLYVGGNRLTDEALPPFTILKELRVLNLSFNEIQEMPSSFLRNLTKLEELYLSGNQLTSIPTEDLPRLTRLSVLFLNGNKLQTLPQELGKVQSLTVIDVGSNLTEQDEFIIIGNRGLWDYISYQAAVDIARSEISDPMIAAQKLRDFAISCGSDGSTMIMVIRVADPFRTKQPVADSLVNPHLGRLPRSL